jgi:hypothetical protein
MLVSFAVLVALLRENGRFLPTHLVSQRGAMFVPAITSGSGDAIWGNVVYYPWLINEPACTRAPYQLFFPVIIGP